ncbi:MAG: hypothetical protein Q4D06_01140 [Coriobacteriia bacterium]|nr:hypothetical protein [Coriobacteriia bacterium]
MTAPTRKHPNHQDENQPNHRAAGASTDAPAKAPNRDRYGRDHKRNPFRIANAVVASFITVLFLGHAFMGELSLVFPVSKNLEPLVFVGLGALALHIILSAITTLDMWLSKTRPASDRKKKHQIKKWVFGVILLIIAGLHIVVMMTPAASLRASGQVIPALLLMGVAAIVLCVHICTGAKSVARDLNLPAEVRFPIRALAISLTLALCLAIALIIAFGI